MKSRHINSQPSHASVRGRRPLVAAAIYRRFAPHTGAVVFDPCAGWGGRLLGAAMAGNVSTYIACEPSSATHAGLSKLATLLHDHWRRVSAASSLTADPGPRPAAVCTMNIDLMRRGAEETPLPPNSIDLVLTSPPYFNLELYTAGEASQSHVKFPTASWWERHFLGALMAHAFVALRPGCLALINVANNRMLLDGGLDLEAAVRRQAARAGFENERTLYMLKPSATADTHAGTSHSEPIFVFRKPTQNATCCEQWATGGARGSESQATRPSFVPTKCDADALPLTADPLTADASHDDDILGDLMADW